MKQYYFTEAGYQKLQAEIEALERTLRNDIAHEIARAAQQGDLNENAEYEAAKAKQETYLSRLAALQERLQGARVIYKEDLPEGIVTLGKAVTIRNVETGETDRYVILGEGETDIDQGIISYLSPLAQALMKHQVGEVVEVNLPRGTAKYEILDIRFFDET